MSLPAQTTSQTFAYSANAESYEVTFDFLRTPDYVSVFHAGADGTCAELDPTEYTLDEDGVLTLLDPDSLQAGDTLTAYASVPIECTADFKAGETLTPDALNEAFDLMTLKLQQLQECLDRVPKLKPGQDLSDLPAGTTLIIDENQYLTT